MARAKKDEQMAIDEKFIEDPDLLEHLEKFMETQEAAKEHKKAKGAINGRLETQFGEAPDGTRVRCGSYVMTFARRVGGGFTVKTWEKSFVGKISEEAS